MQRTSRPRPTLLDAAALPVEELAQLAAREGKRPRAVYGAHKWFARRAGSAFRALLVASALPDNADFWQGYYGEADLSGLSVLDPFVGGGTSVVEAGRLGATTYGIDVDEVACAVTSFETRAATAGDPLVGLQALKDIVAPQLARFYRTTAANGEEREVLHFFWVQVVPCGDCGQDVEAHPHYQLAYQAEGDRQWAFCSQCHEPQEMPKGRKSFTCKHCSCRTLIHVGTVERGALTCPHCSVRERLIDVASRTGKCPQWRLFALESIPLDRPGAGRVHMTGRTFHAASEADCALYEEAAREGRKIAAKLLAPLADVVPTAGRSDDRLVRYGYRKYRQLFNDRQLFHLGALARALGDLPEDQREAAALAFSDHLTTNCMMTCYAFGWRRLVPLFAVRAFRHVPRPVEINPWLDGVGRGTYPNALRQVARAIAAAKTPTELRRDGGDIRVPARKQSPATIFHGTARSVPLADKSIDFVLTDPPYFDNIDYSELADFYRPWLPVLGLKAPSVDSAPARSQSLAAAGRSQNAADDFAVALAESMSEVQRVLVADGRLAFTFRHNTLRGWEALATALWSAGGFRCVQVFPLLAEGVNAMHTHAKSGTWDAVFVLAKGAPLREFDQLEAGDLANAEEHARQWTSRLEAAELDVPFREQDAINFAHACMVAASLGAYIERPR